MASESNIFRFHSSTLNFRKIGQGPRVVFAFHGFGQNGRAFEALATQNTENYAFYCFDLFFHESSTWGEELPIEKGRLNELFTAFAEEQKIQNFSLLAFSIGARFALSLVETMPHRIESVCLVAPDGLVKNPWYTLATASSINRMLFKSIVTHPAVFIGAATYITRLGIIRPSLNHFVQQQLRIPRNGIRIYETWVHFRRLNARPSTLNRVLQEQGITLRIVSGVNDELISKSKLTRLSASIKQIKLITLNTTHTKLLSYLERIGLDQILG